MNFLISFVFEKGVHQVREVNKNNELGKMINAVWEVGQQAPLAAPDHYSSSLNFQGKKGGELEGLT